ncbi:hypothetical protein BH18VER1_BH18VER1_04280 [soil metagenome]
MVRPPKRLLLLPVHRRLRPDNRKAALFPRLPVLPPLQVLPRLPVLRPLPLVKVAPLGRVTGQPLQTDLRSMSMRS